MHPIPVASLLLLCSSLILLLSIDPAGSAETTEIRAHCDSSGGICSNLVCSYNKIDATLSVPRLREKNVHIPSIHLRDRRCTGFPYDAESVYIVWSLGENICGTELIVDSTHAYYKNQIYLPPDPAAIIIREAYIINVTCTYPLNLNTSLPGVLRPDLSITYIGIENSGTFKVKMAIYPDINYVSPYTAPVVELSTRSTLYVGVFIEDPTYDFNLLMINCFSTPTNNIYDPVKYKIIIDSCRNPADTTINILQNGVSTMGKFYLQMFKFIGDYSYVYLHCEVYLCKGSCAPNCLSRSSGDIPKAQATLSIGPIKRSDSASDSVGKATGFSIVAIIGLALMNMFSALKI
ncbi:uromodulin-like [Mixophyes fleayi]|uniref:uromodulin-like n=1 Tax=Mixophyes fleayi TaxID=3061075 RepID=UPI003F4DAC26